MVRKLLVGCGLALVSSVAWASPAFAHITVDPESAAKGSEATLAFRVPNEQPIAATTEVQIFFPSDHPVLGVDPQPTPGWQDKIVTQALNPPVQTDDGPVTSYVSEIDWTAGTIPPGHFQQFLVLAQGLPKDADQVVFKALQTYSDGTVVRWIDPVVAGQPAPDHPTPILALTGPPPVASNATTTTPLAGGQPVTSPKAATSDTTTTLAIVAIVLAAIALVVTAFTVIVPRRRTA